jgi:hypothetical protein
MSVSFVSSAVRSALNLPALEPGWVWLVGAGPGDPGLLTLHALSALQQADVIVHDALVDDAILKLAQPTARIEFAGKRGGKPSPKQRDISIRLIELARAGKRWVGLSDFTAFHLAMLARARAVTWAGPALIDDFGVDTPEAVDPVTLGCFREAMSGELEILGFKAKGPEGERRHGDGLQPAEHHTSE